MALTITATIKTQAEETNTVDLAAVESGTHNAPNWEYELIAPQYDPANWNREIADQVLVNHGYRREGEWWNSTEDTGFDSWSTTVVEDKCR